MVHAPASERGFGSAPKTWQDSEVESVADGASGRQLAGASLDRISCPTLDPRDEDAYGADQQ